MSTTNSQYLSSLQFVNQRSLSKELFDITNEDGTFVDMLEAMGRYEVTAQPFYRNFINLPLFQVETINGTPTDNGSGLDFDIVLTAADGTSSLRPGHLVLCANRAVGLVTSVTADAAGDQINIVSVDSTALGLADTQKLSVVGDASGEGSVGPVAFRNGVSNYENKIQIMKEAYEIEDIAAGSQIEFEFNGQPYYFLKGSHDALMKFKHLIAFNMITSRMSTTSFGDASPSLTDAQGKAIQTTMGLDQYVTTYGINDPSVTVNTAYFASLKRDFVRSRCGNDYLLLAPTEWRIALTNMFTGLNSALSTNVRQNVNLTSLGQTYDFDVTAFNFYGINYQIKELKSLDHAEVFNFTGSAGYEKTAYFVPNDQINVQGGGSKYRMGIRYMDLNVLPGQYGNGKIREIHTGGLAPTPTSDESVFRITFEKRCGLDIYGPHHFAKGVLS